MAQKKKVKSIGTILFIDSYQDNVLTIKSFGLSHMRTQKHNIAALDRELLRVLDTYQIIKKAIGGIVLSQKSLGGFSSTRLILTTLNALTWLKGIPMVALPVPFDEEITYKVLQGMFAKKKAYSRRITPVYLYPPDITPPKVKSTFTID